MSRFLPHPLELIDQHTERSVSVIRKAVSTLRSEIARTADAMIACLENGGRILVCGNGGSASDATHFSSELLNRYREDRVALAAIALTTDASTLTSIANDHHFDQVFSRQVAAIGHAGDILLAISTSGNSDNILRAQQTAKEGGLTTVLLTGRDGGAAAALCNETDLLLCVSDNITAHIQEAHGVIIHCICALIESHFLSNTEES